MGNISSGNQICTHPTNRLRWPQASHFSFRVKRLRNLLPDPLPTVRDRLKPLLQRRHPRVERRDRRGNCLQPFGRRLRIPIQPGGKIREAVVEARIDLLQRRPRRADTIGQVRQGRDRALDVGEACGSPPCALDERPRSRHEPSGLATQHTAYDEEKIWWVM